LLLPEHLKAGSAWGEWGFEEMSSLVGYIPTGLKQLSSIWTAPVPDYSFPEGEGKGPIDPGLAYVFSAILGVGLTIGCIFLLGKLLIDKGKK